MKRGLLLTAGLILASCTADHSKDAGKVKSAELDGACVATPAHFDNLRDAFRTAAKKVASSTTDTAVSFDKGTRQPLERPFAEPPHVRFAVTQNPFGLEYGWIVKLSEGCLYSKAESGHSLKSVDLDVRIDGNGQIIDDKIHYKIDNK